jgi:predicted  nucleic acid-binding Zn-ribbon protein
MTLSRARQNQIANEKAISTDQVGQVDTSGTGNLDLVSEQYDDILTEDIGLGANDRAESDESPEASGNDAAIADLVSDLSDVEERVTQSESAIDTAEGNITALQSDVSDLNDRVTALET